MQLSIKDRFVVTAELIELSARNLSLFNLQLHRFF